MRDTDANRTICELITLLKDEFSYPENVRFFCLKCGTCCGDTELKQRHILLMKSEAEKISKLEGLQIADFAEKHKGRGPYLFEIKKTKDRGQCLFLKNNRCAIYSKRPMICRFYPFELRPTAKKRFEFLCTTECPGIGIGTLLDKRYFEKLFRLVCKKR